MAKAGQAPQSDLTVFLLKEGSTADTVLPSRDTLDHFAITAGSRSADLFVRRHRAAAPRWAAFFRGQLDSHAFGAISSVSAVLMVETSGRQFALTFGHGRLLLADDCWDERFGLRIALNSVSGKIRSVDTQTLDSLGRHARIQASRDARVLEFGVDVEQDLLRAVTGRPDDDRIGSRVTGRDALRTTARVELGTLPQFLRRLLEKSQENTYKRDFPWVDHIRDIADDASVRELDDQLAKRLEDGRTEGISLAVPEIIDWNDISAIRYLNVGDRLDHVELNLDDPVALLQEHDGQVSAEGLSRCRVSAVDANGTQIHGWRLHKCIHAEMTLSGAAYVLSAGRWFRVHKGFAKEVDEAFQSVPRLANPLPPFGDASESAYCRRVAGINGEWIVMDRAMIRYGGGKSQVEFCDLFAPDHQRMLHVKRYAGSSPLSHLFAQALVAGETFRVDPQFRDAVNGLLPVARRLPTPVAAPEGYSMILGIAKTDPFDLPFFAKVALRHAVRRLGGFGYSVQLAHIVVPDDFAIVKRARR